MTKIKVIKAFGKPEPFSEQKLIRPSLNVTGLDVDEKILTIAKQKITKLNLPIQLQQIRWRIFSFH